MILENITLARSLPDEGRCDRYAFRGWIGPVDSQLEENCGLGVLENAPVSVIGTSRENTLCLPLASL